MDKNQMDKNQMDKNQMIVECMCATMRAMPAFATFRQLTPVTKIERGYGAVFVDDSSNSNSPFKIEVRDCNVSILAILPDTIDGAINAIKTKPRF